MSIPDQAETLGGVFTCPRCRIVTTLAPVAALAGPPALITTRPANKTKDKFVQGLLICVGVCVGSLVLVAAAPLFATVLGAMASTLAALYLFRPVLRPRVDALFRVQHTKPWHKQSIAALSGVWSFLALVLYGGWVASGGPARAEAEKTANAAAEREASEKQRQDEDAAQRALSDAKLDEAETFLGSGQVDRANEVIERAKVLSPANPRISQVQEKVEKVAREQALATLPDKRNAILDKVKAGAWAEAGRLCVEARAIAPKEPQIEGSCVEVDAELRKLETIRWIAAANRAAAEQCDVPTALGEAWKNLRQIRADEGGFNEAKKSAAKLEKCRKTAERTLSAGLRALMVSQRISWADRYETSLLDDGIDADVIVHGKNKDFVKVRYILVGRALVHQITKDGEFLASLEKIGFKRVTFSDGFDESWYFDLSPQSEDEGGKLALRDAGLGEPIKM